MDTTGEQQQQQQQQQPPQQPLLTSTALSTTMSSITLGAPAPAARASATHMPRSGEMKTYDGSIGATLDEWLDDLSRISFFYRLPAEDTVRYAVMHLRQAAFQWWQALTEVERMAISNQDVLATRLRERFQPVSAERLARQQICSLTQGARNIEAYIADFRRLRALVPTMGEDDARYQFERGLSSSLREKLIMQDIVSLSQAITFVARVGNLQHAAQAAQSHPKGTIHRMEEEEGDGASTGAGSVESDAASAIKSMQLQLNAISQRLPPAATQRGGKTQRGGRGGRSNGGATERAFRGQVPGVPDEVVQQRWRDKQCLRCGEAGHASISCPNSISAASTN